MHMMPTGGGAGLQDDSLFSSIGLLIQPHAGDVGIAGLHDRGPGQRVATLENGSVSIVEDWDRSPIHGAYADPGAGCRISYSDDAGLIPATGGSATIEALVQPETVSIVWNHGLFGAGPNTNARHFQTYVANNSGQPHFYGYDTAINDTTFDSFTVDHAYAVDGPIINITIQIEGSYICMWWNGHPLAGATLAHNVNANDWAVGWSKFLLFQDVPGGTDFVGNLIALRYTLAPRFTLGSAFVPNVWGFPEQGT